MTLFSRMISTARPELVQIGQWAEQHRRRIQFQIILYGAVHRRKIEWGQIPTLIRQPHSPPRSGSTLGFRLILTSPQIVRIHRFLRYTRQITEAQMWRYKFSQTKMHRKRELLYSVLMG